MQIAKFPLLLAAMLITSVSSDAIAQPEASSAPSNLTQSGIEAIPSDSSEADRLFEQGMQQFYQGQLQNALQMFQQVLERRKQVNDRLGEAESLNSIAAIYNRLGNSSEAQELIEQSLAIAKDASLLQPQRRQAIEAEALDSLGEVWFIKQDFAKALEAKQSVLTMRQQLGDHTGKAETLILVGGALLYQGQQAEAKEALDESLRILREPNASVDELRRRRFYEGEALAWLGYFELSSGNAEQAGNTLEQALAINHETGNRSYGESNTLAFLAALQSNQSKFGETLETYQQLLNLNRQIGNRKGEGAILIAIGNVNQTQNQNDQALANYQQGLKIFQEIGDHLGEADTLAVIANTYQKQENYQQSLEPYYQALEIYREVGNRPKELSVLQSISLAHAILKQPSQVIEALQKAIPLLTDIKNLLNGNDPNIINLDLFLSQNYLTIGQSYFSLGNNPEAQEYLIQGINYFQQTLSNARENNNQEIEDACYQGLLSSYWQLASTYQEQKQYKQAIDLLGNASEIAEQIGDQERKRQLSENFIVNYALQGQAFGEQQNYEGVLENWQQVLRIAQENNLLRWQSTALLGIGNIYSSRQNFAQALNYHQQSLAIAERANDRALQAQTLFARGGVYLKLLRYTEALEDFQDARSLLEATGDSLGGASILSSIGNIYIAQNQYDQALNAFQEANRVFQNNPFSPFQNEVNADNVESFCAVAQQVGAVEGIFAAADNCDSAYELGAEALKQPFVLSGLDSVLKGVNRTLLTLQGSSLHSIGQINLNQGNNDQALAFYRQALPILHEVESPIEGATLGDMGIIYLLQGEYDQAVALSQQAVEISRTYEHQINEEDALYYLAIAEWAKGDFSSALNTLSQKAQIENESLANNLAIGSEERKRTFLSGQSRSVDIALTFHLQAAPQNLEAARLAFNTVLQRKGRILDAVANNVQRLRQNLQPADQKIFDDLNIAYAELANLLYDKQSALSGEELKAQVTTLEAKIDEWESTLAQHSTEFQAEVQPITIESVQALVPADAALVEFVRYSPYSPTANPIASEAFGTPHYAAAILTNQGNPKWIDLGEANPIDQAVEQLRRGLRNKNTPAEVKEDGQTLYNLLMSQVQAEVGNVRHLLISPDSQLNLIPFAALVTPQNQYLVETHTITYLTSGRDLLRLQIEAANRASQQSSVIIANPDFDHPGNAEPAQVVSVPSNSELRLATQESNQRSGYLGTITFPPLDGTHTEAVAIASLFPDALKLEESQATENAIKQLHAPSLLHIATHGFFLGDAPSDTQADTNTALNDENPLLRSGLALAGANIGQSGNGDGVLTALEVTGLDLLGTHLVVLSACDTGLGDILNGEGVYGLRRAFVIAGAESQMVSLWRVGDTPSAEVMSNYYQLLKAGHNRSEALRQVQIEMIKSSNYSHPYYWSAFTFSGDWRDLESF
jgi:CHAT domain-containing protein